MKPTQEIKDQIHKMAEEYRNLEGDIPSTELEKEISKLGFQDGAEAVMERLDINLATAYVILTNWNFNIINSEEAKQQILNAIKLKTQ